MFAPVDTPLDDVVRAAGSRWSIEEGFERAKSDVAPDTFPSLAVYVGLARVVGRQRAALLAVPMEQVAQEATAQAQVGLYVKESVRWAGV